MASSDTLIEAHKIGWSWLYHKIFHCYHLVFRRLQVYTGSFLLLVSQWVHFLQFCLLRTATVLRAKNSGLCRMARGCQEKAWRRSFVDANDHDQSGEQIMINLGPSITDCLKGEPANSSKSKYMRGRAGPQVNEVCVDRLWLLWFPHKFCIFITTSLW